MESEDGDSNIDFYEKLDGEPVHVDADCRQRKNQRPFFIIHTEQIGKRLDQLHQRDGIENDNRNDNTSFWRSKTKFRQSEWLEIISCYWMSILSDASF